VSFLRFRIRDNCNLGRVSKQVITLAENVVMQTCPKVSSKLNKSYGDVTILALSLGLWTMRQELGTTVDSYHRSLKEDNASDNSTRKIKRTIPGE
jgi:hypothetical protein